MENTGSILYYRERDGTLKPIVVEDGALTFRNYLEAIAHGDIEGHESWVKVGYNGALSSSFEDLWPVGGTYVQPTAEMQMEVVSSSTDDDGSPAGTGVRTVRLFYLDDAFTEKTEDITLNGTTPVATVATDIYRVQRMITLTVGSVGAAVGDIDIRHIDNTPIYGRISAGYNTLRQLIYTVPAGKTLYVNNVFISAAGTVANRAVSFQDKGTYDRFTGAIVPCYQIFSEFLVMDNAIDVPLEIPTKFPTGVDIKASAISPEGATVGNIIWRGWLEHS